MSFASGKHPKQVPDGAFIRPRIAAMRHGRRRKLMETLLNSAVMMIQGAGIAGVLYGLYLTVNEDDRAQDDNGK
jgi:hypothetical protein